MAIERMNHAVLYVRDAEGTYEFYRDVFGFRVVMEMPGAKFLQAPDSDQRPRPRSLPRSAQKAGPSARPDARPSACTTSRGRSRRSPDLREIAGKLSEAGALTGATDHSTTKALYGRDPDGLEFEVCWIVPKERLQRRPNIEDGRARMRALDIDAEIERFGLETVGGV